MENLTQLQKLKVISEIECKSKATIESYERHIEKFTKLYGETPEQNKIIDYLYYLRTKKNYDKSSLNVVKSALKYYYREILDQQLNIKLYTIKRRKNLPKPLAKSTIKSLIDNIKNQKHKLLVELAYDGGFRPEEVISLKWEDVDFDNGIIRVNRGKGDKDRNIYISDNVMKHLMDYKISRKNKNCEYIFDSGYKPETHICKRTFQEIVKKTSKKIGIDFRIYPYQLRHSFATHLKESGVLIEDIQKRMGHSSIRTTMIYAEVVSPKEKPKTPMDDEYFNKGGLHEISCKQ